MIPVVAPLGTGRSGRDLQHQWRHRCRGNWPPRSRPTGCLLLTDVAGVKDESGEVITDMRPDQVRELTARGMIAGGMIPKTETALMPRSRAACARWSFSTGGRPTPACWNCSLNTARAA
jgi:acetylglutamate kinase